MFWVAGWRSLKGKEPPKLRILSVRSRVNSIDVLVAGSAINTISVPNGNSNPEKYNTKED